MSLISFIQHLGILNVLIENGNETVEPNAGRWKPTSKVLYNFFRTVSLFVPP